MKVECSNPSLLPEPGKRKSIEEPVVKVISCNCGVYCSFFQKLKQLRLNILIYKYCVCTHLYMQFMYTDWDAYAEGLYWSSYGTGSRKKRAVQRNEIYHWN